MPSTRVRRLAALAAAAGLTAVLTFTAPWAAHAAVDTTPAGDRAPAPDVLAVNDLPTVIAGLQTWIIGILAAAATLFLVIGGLRYVTAGGDPSEIERAKGALKSAAMGYALAILAPVLMTALKQILGV